MTSTPLPRHPDAEIEAHPDLPAITITRDFNATPAQLMRAHLDRSLFVRWCGPADTTVHVDVWDARPLGSYRYSCTGADGVQHWFRGTFPEVSETRLVQTFCYEGYPEAIALETMTFTALGQHHTRLTGFSLYPSVEARNGMLASGMDTGVNDGYAAIDSLLSEGIL